jgi:hypothetical protein
MRFTPALSRAPRSIVCRTGGSPSFGGSGDRQPPPRLIIPGQEGGARPGGGLVVPGGAGNTPSGGSLDLAGSGAPPVVRNFRPPPGFMNKDGPASSDIGGATSQEMLNRLQAQSGQWHQLAKLLPLLQAQGMDAFAVEDTTGLERKTQNLWTSAASIYDALKASGKVDPDVMAYFDTSGAEALLHELRYLSLRQRTAAVAYIAENQLDEIECTVLARAIKEHERRAGRREGFTDSPRDSLAYKFYRDALECRRPEDAAICAKKGLALVESEEGRKRLLEVCSEDTEEDIAAAAAAGPAASLTVLRLEREEVGCRPIALAGALSTVTADRVRSAPKVASEGPFGAFAVPVDCATWSWIPLPAWAIVALAGRPVAFDVPNCADFAPLRATVKVKSDDDLRKLQGPGLMVIDIAPEFGVTVDVLEPLAYYAVAAEGGGVDVVDGAMAVGKDVLGPVLFLCRPPNRDSTNSATAELAF